MNASLVLWLKSRLIFPLQMTASSELDDSSHQPRDAIAADVDRSRYRIALQSLVAAACVSAADTTEPAVIFGLIPGFCQKASDRRMLHSENAWSMSYSLGPVCLAETGVLARKD